MKNYSEHKSPLGAFLAGVLATVAVGGYVFFGSKKAKRNREKVDWWIEDVQDEVMQKMSQIKDASSETFDSVVDEVMRKYKKFKYMKEDKIERIKNNLRERWREIQSEVEEDTDDE